MNHSANQPRTAQSNTQVFLLVGLCAATVACRAASAPWVCAVGSPPSACACDNAKAANPLHEALWHPNLPRSLLVHIPSCRTRHNSFAVHVDWNPAEDSLTSNLLKRNIEDDGSVQYILKRDCWQNVEMIVHADRNPAEDSLTSNLLK
jgi:hypothetical protein